MIKPILTSLGVSKDGTTITLKDATGAYTIDNTGGYGAPNPIAPTKVGIRWRYWADTIPYANRVLTGAGLVAELLGAGHAFNVDDVSDFTVFATGVHQFNYYPLETTDCIITVVNGSKKITVTAGANQPWYNPDYKAAVVTDALGNVLSQVLMIDRTQNSNTEFYVDQAWPYAGAAGYKLLVGTEADLKVLMTAGAEACVARKIGHLPSRRYCDAQEINETTDLLSWIFAANIKLQCGDYSGAHNLIVSVEKQCAGNCATETNCKTCSA